MASEPFSWSKFFGGFSTLVGWAKFASFWIKVAMIVVPILGSVWVYHHVYTKGYNKGYAVGMDVKNAEWMKYEAEHPRQTFTGDHAQVNNNVRVPNNRFQFGVFPLRIGWCE